MRVISLDEGDQLASLAVLQTNPVEVAPEAAVDDAADEDLGDEVVEGDDIADVDEVEVDSGEDLANDVEVMTEETNGASQ